MSTLTLKGLTSGSSVLKAPDSGSNEVTFTMPASTGTLLTTTGSGANLTGLSSFDPDGAVVFNESGADVDFRIESDDNANMFFVDGGEDRVGIGTGTPAAKLDLGNTTSNTVGGTETLRMGEQAFRLMTGNENAVMCLDRDNAGGTKKIMQAWNPDNGSVSIGNQGPNARGILALKSNDITQCQLNLTGANYAYGAEIMHQNGAESGTVGNTRGWSKWDIYTLGNTRRFWTASSQVGTDTQYWSVNNTKIMDIDNDGMFNIRSFSATGASAGATFNTEGKLTISANTSSSRNLIGFYNTNVNVGNIIASGSSTSYSTSSDYRLKENVVDMTGAITRLKTLQPKIFNWIADDTNTLVDGFIAHEVTAVPEAIIGEKDAMIAEVLYTQDDENLEIIPEGKIIGDVKEPARIDPQTIDQSKLVPLLTGALQEAIAKIEELTTRIETLEAN